MTETAICTCSPDHLDLGAYDPDCPTHDITKSTTNPKETPA